MFLTKRGADTWALRLARAQPAPAAASPPAPLEPPARVSEANATRSTTAAGRERRRMPAPYPHAIRPRPPCYHTSRGILRGVCHRTPDLDAHCCPAETRDPVRDPVI